MIPFVAAAEIPCFGRKNSCFFVLRSLREELGHWTNAPVPLVCCRCSASTYQTGPFFYVTGNVKNSGKNILKIFFVKLAFLPFAFTLFQSLKRALRSTSVSSPLCYNGWEVQNEGQLCRGPTRCESNCWLHMCSPSVFLRAAQGCARCPRGQSLSLPAPALPFPRALSLPSQSSRARRCPSAPWEQLEAEVIKLMVRIYGAA